jgi:hypothetical protein
LSRQAGAFGAFATVTASSAPSGWWSTIDGPSATGRGTPLTQAASTVSSAG